MPIVAQMLFSMKNESKHYKTVTECVNHSKTLTALTATTIESAFASIGAVIVTITARIVAIGTAIAVEFNTPAFNCGVGTTKQMYNRVTNLSKI